MELTSLDYTKLIAWIAAFKHRVILNKTQMQKLLFMCYGQALVLENRPLFTDDTPKAWPFGPVFPRSYKRYEETLPDDLTDEDKRRFSENRDVLLMIAQTVANFCHTSATRLSEWSHQPGSPWQQTVFSGDNPEWNRPIPPQIIQEYFSNSNWSSGIK